MKVEPESNMNLEFAVGDQWRERGQSSVGGTVQIH